VESHGISTESFGRIYTSNATGLEGLIAASIGANRATNSNVLGGLVDPLQSI